MTASWRCGPGVTMPWPGCRSSSPKCVPPKSAGGCFSIGRSRRRGDGACPRCAGTGPRPEPIASVNARPAELRSTRLNTKFTSVNHWPTRSFLSSDQPTVKASRSPSSGAIVPGLAALFLNEMNAFDADAALDRLDHVVDREARDRRRGQRLHLDAGWARDLDGSANDAAGQLVVGRNVQRDL